MQLAHASLPSPIGTILAVFDAQGRAYALDFGDHEPRLLALLRRFHGEATLRPAAVPARIGDALAAYWEGDLAAPDTIPVATTGGLAATLGQPGAARAVGLANGANPVAVAVPCHRVVGANGTLTGYGGGLERKRWLLAHERGQRPLAL